MTAAAAPDPEEVAARTEALIAELAAHADPVVRSRAEELVRQVMTLYGAGLARAIDLSFEQDEATARALWQRAAADPLVGSLLALHGLHPDTIERRLARAVDRLRPALAERGLRVSIAGIGDNALRLRVDAGSAAAVDQVRTLVERAIAEAAPEIDRVEFEGVAPAALPLLFLTRADGTPVGQGRPGAPAAGAPPSGHRAALESEGAA